MATATATSKLLTDAKGRVAVASGRILPAPGDLWVNVMLGPCGAHQSLAFDAEVMFEAPDIPALLHHDPGQEIGRRADNLTFWHEESALWAAVALWDDAVSKRALAGLQLGAWHLATYGGDPQFHTPGALTSWSIGHRAEYDGKLITFLQICEVSLTGRPARIGAGLTVQFQWMGAAAWQGLVARDSA